MVTYNGGAEYSPKYGESPNRWYFVYHGTTFNRLSNIRLHGMIASASERGEKLGNLYMFNLTGKAMSDRKVTSADQQAFFCSTLDSAIEAQSMSRCPIDNWAILRILVLNKSGSLTRHTGEIRIYKNVIPNMIDLAISMNSLRDFKFFPIVNCNVPQSAFNFCNNHPDDFLNDSFSDNEDSDSKNYSASVEPNFIDEGHGSVHDLSLEDKARSY